MDVQSRNVWVGISVRPELTYECVGHLTRV